MDNELPTVTVEVTAPEIQPENQAPVIAPEIVIPELPELEKQIETATDLVDIFRECCAEFKSAISDLGNEISVMRGILAEMKISVQVPPATLAAPIEVEPVIIPVETIPTTETAPVVETKKRKWI